MHSLSNRNSGSVLITSVIFGFALFAVVAGYVYLTTQSMRLANRSFHLNSAMNLAEAGIEEGLFTLNTYKPFGYSTPVASAYDNWTTGDFDGDGIEDAKRTFSYFSSNQSTAGEFTVIISNRLLANEKANPPKLIVQARSAVANQGTIEKYVRALTGRRSLTSNAMVSRRGIRFDGNNASVDSYDGDRGPYEYDQFTAGLKEIAEDYVANGGNGDGVVNRFANATVASASVGVSLGNADVWGYVATSGSSPNVGPNGYINDMVYPLPTPSVNPERVSLDFQANFPIVDIPPDGTGTVYSAFPGAVANEVVIGVPGSPTPEIYKISGNYSFSGTTKFRVIGPVRIIISGNFIAQTANNELIIDNGPIDPTDPTGPKNFDNVFANATMTRLTDDNIPPFQIWVGGNLDLGSGGIVNPSTTPASFQIYGTAPVPTGTSGTQTITLSGGSAGTFWAAAVYAPNADITINGSKEVFGAFVANSIRVMGDSHFHYDESMARKGTGKYAIELWRELLTPAQRTAYTW